MSNSVIVREFSTIHPTAVAGPLVHAIDLSDPDVTRVVQVPESETVLHCGWRFVRELATVAAVCTALAALASILSI